jgi:arsenite oxidase large subunit
VSDPNRRDVAKLLGLGAAATAAGCSSGGDAVTPKYLLPPTNARVQSTVCAYCIVGCGYKVYDWPVGQSSGGLSAHDNALGVDYPTQAFGPWISPEMYAEVTIGGLPHHMVVLPDPDAEVVNLGGDHTLGGSLAKRFYTEDGPTADRFLFPQIRIGDTRHRVTWDEALEVVAQVSRYIIDNWGELAWGMKTYSYQFYENTFAITKLAFAAVETPCWAPHDKTAEGSDTPGLSDAGINVFSASYQDWHDADVIYCSGVSLYDAHGVLFSQWVARGGAKLIVVNPRRDPTADYALLHGGMFLQIEPGTDTALHNAIARVILENGWQDRDFIEQFTATERDLADASQTKWRQNRFSMTFEDYEAWILNDPDTEPETAAALCGITADEIRACARMMAKPSVEGTHPSTSVMLEKGNYWSHNYYNTASLASMALLVGAGNRPGRMVSRAGGHQRGMIKAAGYPEHKSPHELDGNKIGLDMDRWVMEGELAFCWVIGCTWAGGGAAASSVLFEAIRQQTQEVGTPLSESVAFPNGTDGGLDVSAVVDNLLARAADGGMVLIQEDIYPQALTELADLILPAASWGEETFTRMQGERRLRLYPQLVDKPGECRPDWQIVGDVATRMGYEGFDWRSGSAIFEEAAPRSEGGPHAYQALIEYARDNATNAREVLRDRGTTGFQCPLYYEEGAIKETPRYHDAETKRGFSTPSGRAHFVGVRWREVETRQAELAPPAGELWVINRRASTNWSSLVEDLRNPFRVEQLPVNYLELHPDDASRLGISDGDPVMVENDAVTEPSPWTDTRTGQFEAVALISDRMRKGTSCAYFNFGGDPALAANSVVPNSTEPITNKQAFKLGRGRVYAKP